MAVEYHLITPFGLTTTVTVDATANTLALATHGMRAGQGFYFLTTSTTLPQVGGVNVSTSTPYYVASDSLSAGTFKVVTASDGSGTPLDFSSAGSSVKIAGKYWTELPTTDPGNGGNYKDRYYYGSAYRVYSGQYVWYSGRDTRKNFKTELICEVEGKFDDIPSGYHTSSYTKDYRSITMTTVINGDYGSGFHNGVPGSGYVRKNSYGYTIATSGTPAIAHGIEIVSTAGTTTAAVFLATPRSSISSCIVTGNNTGTSTGAIHLFGGGVASHNLVHSSTGVGIFIQGNSDSQCAFFNTVIGCATGFFAGQGNASASVFIVGNVAYGNTENWNTNKPFNGYWEKNAGDSDGGGGFTGGTPWTTTGLSNIALGDSDFRNYVVPLGATSDFRPSGDSTAHTSSSLLVDVISQEFAEMPPYDLGGNVRPSYKNGAATNWDIGCYEFDWGYGDAPASTVITITAQASLSGAEVRIYDLDNSPAGTYGTELSGTESHNASTYTYTGSTGNVIGIQIMQSGYEEFTQTITLENSTQSLNITLRPDINA
jgi:hypothetical protein